MLDRQLVGELALLAREYPVITILGPRQAGKTTLARAAFPKHGYVNLEDPEVRAIAAGDARAFFRSHPPPLVIDEIQRVPELCSWIQVLIDERKRMGEFVLTGSSQLDLHAAISQSLAGRNALARLYPFSFGELAAAGVALDRDDLLVRGFFPRVQAEGQEPTRAYRNYLQTYVERDLRALLNIRNIVAFERFLGLLAGRVGQLVNLHALAADSGVTSTTLGEWLAVLEASFLVYRLKPFHENCGKRLVKAPKLYFTDVGLATALLGIRTPAAAARDPLLGNLFENMVVMDAVKQLANRGQDGELYFFRDQNGREVDLILERDRELTPIEIKAGMTWNPEFAAQLHWFRKLPLRTGRGLVVYGGEQTVEGEEYTALPFRRFTLQ